MASPAANGAPMQPQQGLYGGLTKEKVKELVTRAQQMHSQGLNEQNSPEFRQLSQFLKGLNQQHQQQQQLQLQQQQSMQASTSSSMQQQQQTNPALPLQAPPVMANGHTKDPSKPDSVALTPAQFATFKVQVLAYRSLSHNQPIAPAILEALQSPQAALQYSQDVEHAQQQKAHGASNNNNNSNNTPASSAAPLVKEEQQPSQAASAAKELQQPHVPPPPAAAPTPAQPQASPEKEVEDATVYETGPVDTSSEIYPYNAYRTPKDLFFDIDSNTKRHSIMPTLLPQGLDPHTLLQERQRYLEARMAQRMSELQGMSATLPDHSEAKLRALIELKSLNLLHKQRQLRHDVLHSMGQATKLALVADGAAYKRPRQPLLKEAREVENFERAQKVERENKVKQKHLDRVRALTEHAQAFHKAHSEAKDLSKRLGKHVLRFHIEAEKAEKARVERVSKERLRALKNDDEEAYLKLIDTAKDTRITHLLRQTDSFLDNLAQSVRQQQKAANKWGLPGSTAEGDDDDDLAHDGEVVDESAFGAAPVFAEDAEQDKTKIDYYNVAHRVKEHVLKQPDILVGGELKPYQIKGLQWMISLFNNRLNGILADEMGLGKTIQTISLITYLIEMKNLKGPYLIIVPLSTMPNWVAEFERWAPSVKVLTYKGTPSVRKNLGEELRRGHFQVCITTYEFIIRDRSNLARPHWVHMIIDEGHRMKNTQSKLSQTLNQHYNTKFRLILTGTPLQNSLPELWALLNFVLPRVFNSVQSFDEWFNAPFANTGGQDKIALNEEEQLLVLRRLHKVLRPFLLRRLKKDVEADLPDKVERIIRCKMSALQMKLYKQMKDHGVLLVEDPSAKGKQGGLKGLQNTIMQLRKICNHPFIYQAVESSVKRPGLNDELLYRAAGKFELLDRILPKLLASKHRVLIFFQMTQIMDIMQDYLAYRNTPNLRLDGNTGQDVRGDIMRQFNSPECNVNVFLLSTRAGGLGLNLQSADTVILYDSDWNPHQDLQAQDRAHRIGQKKEVRIFRLVTSQSVEEHIVATANLKKEMDSKVIQAGKFDNSSTNAEREEHLRAVLEATIEEDDVEGDYTEAELNDILARSDAELELFSHIDTERRRSDEAHWRSRNPGPMPERLIQESELPPVYRKEPTFTKKEEEPVFDPLSGRRRRQAAGNVTYDDGLSEEQFLKAVEDESGGGLHGAMEASRARKERKRQKRMYDLDDPGSPNSDYTGRGPSGANSDSGSDLEEMPRKRGRPSASVEPSIDGDDDRSKRRKTGGKTLKGAGSELKPTYKQILEGVKELNAPEGYPATALFNELPNKKEYPDYYLLITQPISLKQINTKVTKGAYKDPTTFKRDWETMFANARVYNDPDSMVVRDAIQIETEFSRLYDALLVNSGRAPSRKRVIPDDDDEEEGSMEAPQPPPPATAEPSSAGSFKLKLGGGSSAPNVGMDRVMEEDS